MTETILIGIAGNMKSGKSTLALTLATRYNLPILSYAESLRMEVAQAFFPKMRKNEARFMWDNLEDLDKSKTRPLLQAWGQARRDMEDVDYWVLRLRKYAQEKGMKFAIVDDVRHINEAEDVLSNGGMIIRIHADTNTLIERGAEDLHLQHASENMIALDEHLVNRSRCMMIDSSGRSPHGMFVQVKEVVQDFLVSRGHENGYD